MSEFLTGQWQNLLMFNYAVDAKVLEPLVPSGTEIDTWSNTCYMSLVGFMFKDTRVRRIAFPYYRNFEEVNLRFYVRFKEMGQWKRGVVFIKEIVPKKLIASIANSLYGERYLALPMANRLIQHKDAIEVAYEWIFNGEKNYLKALTEKNPTPIIEGSEAEFITEHYWGYTQLRKEKTSEYEVKHPKWRVHNVLSYDMFCNAEALYGNSLAPYLNAAPLSVFMAEGSSIAVMNRRIIRNSF